MTKPLTNAQRTTLRAVCDTFLPGMTGEPRALFGTSAADFGVAEAMELAVTYTRPEQQREFRLLLDLLAQPLMMLVLAKQPHAFAKLDAAARERVLLAMANSSVPPMRSGFQVLKRLSTYLFYALPRDEGVNPVWRAVGYEPSEKPPAIESPLKITAITRDEVIDCDVCVIGSGAGGAVIAARLAAAGKRVVVLEAAVPLQPPDFTQRELGGTENMFLERGLLATKDSGITILAGAALGGGTVVNWQTSLRTPDDVREEWETASGCTQFTSRTYTAALDAVCERLSVGTGESVVNPNNDALRRGAEALGYSWKTITRNSNGCDPTQCGYCVYGCRHGGKQTTAVTWLRDAQRLGNTTIIASCKAECVRLIGGRVTGVSALATGANGIRYRVEVKAMNVVAAAGAIETPALLLRSHVNNVNIGRHLFLHPVTAAAGLYEEIVEPWTGPPQTIMCDHFSRIDGMYGFVMEAAPAHPAMLALALPWMNARAHRERMSQISHASALIAIVRDRSTGRVTIDRSGRAMVDYQPGVAETALLRKGVVEAAKIHAAAGATEIATLHQRDHSFRVAGSSPEDVARAYDRLAVSEFARNRSTLFTAHQMGTCRMGSERRTAVCDERGEVYGARGLYIGDASAFPLSSGVNPMITIMAMAYITADHISHA